jgi:hypothetical protein
MDATETLIRQQQRMRDLVRPHLSGVMRFDGGEIHQALRDADLLGRYLSVGSGRLPPL